MFAVKGKQASLRCDQSILLFVVSQVLEEILFAACLNQLELISEAGARLHPFWGSKEGFDAL
jgi:hypothetical protein